jgi:hypothetical protein
MDLRHAQKQSTRLTSAIVKEGSRYITYISVFQPMVMYNFRIRVISNAVARMAKPA